MPRYKTIKFIVVLSLVFSTTFSLSAEKARAFLGDSVSGTAMLAMDIADAIARALAQAMIQRMVNSTVNWAQSGFDGNPAYVTDPEQYFTDLADGVAGDFIAGSKVGSTTLDFLCSPFQLQVRLALRQKYLYDQPFQCTLTGIVSNLEAYYEDFNQGGWDGWYAMTQNNANNPYGAYINAQIELDNRIAKAVGLKNDELNRNKGFLSWEQCPSGTQPQKAPDGTEIGGCIGTDSTTLNPYVVSKRTVTPGVVIGEQLNKVLPSNMERFVNAQHVEDLIEAFISGALNRFVFGPQGLFSGGKGADVSSGSSGSGSTAPNGIDIDGDGVDDIIYTDNGELFCTQGGEYPSCQGSKNIETNSYSNNPGEGDVCATQEEIDQFLESNPGDEGRLSSAFPC